MVLGQKANEYKRILQTWTIFKRRIYIKQQNVMSELQQVVCWNGWKGEMNLRQTGQEPRSVWLFCLAVYIGDHRQTALETDIYIYIYSIYLYWLYIYIYIYIRLVEWMRKLKILSNLWKFNSFSFYTWQCCTWERILVFFHPESTLPFTSHAPMVSIVP